MATPPIVTTLVSDLDHNTLHIQNGLPIGGSISAVLPSVRTILPIFSELAPLALSLGNIGNLGNLGALGDLGDLGNLGALGARLLPSIPSIQLPSLQFPLPIQLPSVHYSGPSVHYSGRSLVPYPYSIYGGARFH